MSKKPHTKESEIKKNLEFFLTELPNLKKSYPGKYILLRHCEIKGAYDTVKDAYMTGNTFFHDEIFSIQKVDDTPINLGFFSYAMPMATAQ